MAPTMDSQKEFEMWVNTVLDHARHSSTGVLVSPVLPLTTPLDKFRKRDAGLNSRHPRIPLLREVAAQRTYSPPTSQCRRSSPLKDEMDLTGPEIPTPDKGTQSTDDAGSNRLDVLAHVTSLRTPLSYTTTNTSLTSTALGKRKAEDTPDAQESGPSTSAAKKPHLDTTFYHGDGFSWNLSPSTSESPTPELSDSPCPSPTVHNFSDTDLPAFQDFGADAFGPDSFDPLRWFRPQTGSSLDWLEEELSRIGGGSGSTSADQGTGAPSRSGR